MTINFKVLHKDMAGRIGRLRVGNRTARTPLLMPVINPHIQLIKPRELAALGVEAIITNAYIFSKSEEFRCRALSTGLHGVLGFDGIIMTDSGAFQQSVYGDVMFSNSETIEFQAAIGSDIIVPMDLATSPDTDYATAEAELKITSERIARGLELAPEGRLAAPVQGGRFEDLRRRAGEYVSSLGVTFCPIGAVVPLMESYRYQELVSVVMAAKRGLSPSACVHLFGAGHPAMFALGVAMGCDVFDSAAYALYAREGRYLTAHGSYRIGEMPELPCACPVCQSHTARELASSPDRERLLATHNLAVSLAEIARVRQAVADGTLWELVDDRCRSHPRLLAGYRDLLGYTDVLERTDRVSKRRFFYRGSEHCSRTEIVRYQRMLPRIELAGNVLVAADGQLRPGYDETLLFKPPFGPYPPALAETFPIGQSELPPWDTDQVRTACRGLRELVAAKPDCRFTIVVEEPWRRIFEETLTGMEVAYEAP